MNTCLGVHWNTNPPAFISFIRPSDVVVSDLRFRDPQSLPHCSRCVDYVGRTRRLEGVLLVTAVQGIALVHHLGQHGLAIGVDLYVLRTAAAAVVPSGGERDDELVVAVVASVALGRPTAVSTFSEAVDGHVRLRFPRHRRRAAVGVVHLAVHAAVGVVVGVTVPGDAGDLPVWAALLGIREVEVAAKTNVCYQHQDEQRRWRNCHGVKLIHGKLSFWFRGELSCPRDR
ncbi:unnamed protein product, partial [Musa banksii]